MMPGRPHTLPMDRLKDPALLAEARALQDDILVVNGLDASLLNEEVVRTLKAGGVHMNLSTLPDLSLSSPFHQFMLDHADDLVPVTTVAGIRAAREAGKVAVGYCWQWVDVDEDLSQLAGYHRIGLRSSGLVYNVGNYIGSGCVDPNPGPLSHYGVQVVEALQELRIVVDIGGHCSEATSYDVLDVAEGPVVCSHTNPLALRDNPRCMTDGLMRAIADTGGAIGIAAFNFFVVREGQATLEEFLRQLDHMIDVAGVDHVGIGLDQIIGRNDRGPVNPVTLPPEAYPQRYEDWIYVEGLHDFTGVPLITAGLLERGYAPGDIEKIMGANWLRVWEEVWGE